MSIDLGQAVDDFYQGRSAPPEVIKMIGIALLREQQGQTSEQIGVELNLPPESVRELKG